MSKIDPARLITALSDPRMARVREQLHKPLAFNFFEATGSVRQELRHSDFLGFLLDPRQNHGLASAFAKAFLNQAAQVASETGRPWPVSIEHCSLNSLRVYREWQHIDLLLDVSDEGLVIIIENKIDSDEHSDQLGRYYRLVEQTYRHWTILCIYLTPEGGLPQQDADREYYLAVDYACVCRAITAVLQHNAGELQPDVALALQHYEAMLRRHIVADTDTEFARLCLRLYSQYHEEIGMLAMHRDQRQTMIRMFFDTLLTASAQFKCDSKNDNWREQRWMTRFAPVEWYQQPELLVSQWTDSRLVLLFQFSHSPKEIVLELAVGYGPKAVHARHQLYDLAQRGHSKIQLIAGDLSTDWFWLYRREMLANGFFAEMTDSAIKQTIQVCWDEFLCDDLPSIMQAVHNIK